MTEPQFREVLNFFRNNAHQNARALLAQYGFSEVDFAHYGMAMKSWSNNMFNEIAFKGVTQQDFDLSKHIKWKLAKNLISFQELINLYISNTDLKDVISSYCLNKYNEYSSDEKDQLQRHGIINENVIFNRDLKKGLVPYNSLHLYRENLEKALFIKDYIKIRYDANQITADEVYYYFTNSFMTNNEVNSYCDKSGVSNPMPQPKAEVAIEESFWTDQVVFDKMTDVILIGSAGAGKTMFLASLLKCCENNNNLRYNTLNHIGKQYGEKITSVLDDGRFVGQTPDYALLSIALELDKEVERTTIFGKKIVSKVAPVNLIEMAGEAFKKTFSAKDKDGIPENIKKAVFNKSNNPKIYLFTIPVTENFISIRLHGSNSETKISAQGFYSHFLDYLQRINEFDNVVGIALVFTKWDCYKAGDAKHFLENKCSNLYTQIEKLVNENPDINAAYFTHSLGNNINIDLRSHEYDSPDITEIYSWILSILPYKG